MKIGHYFGSLPKILILYSRSGCWLAQKTEEVPEIDRDFKIRLTFFLCDFFTVAVTGEGEDSVSSFSSILTFLEGTMGSSLFLFRQCFPTWTLFVKLIDYLYCEEVMRLVVVNGWKESYLIRILKLESAFLNWVAEVHLLLEHSWEESEVKTVGESGNSSAKPEGNWMISSLLIYRHIGCFIYDCAPDVGRLPVKSRLTTMTSGEGFEQCQRGKWLLEDSEARIERSVTRTIRSHWNHEIRMRLCELCEKYTIIL